MVLPVDVLGYGKLRKVSGNKNSKRGEMSDGKAASPAIIEDACPCADEEEGSTTVWKVPKAFQVE